RRRRGRAFACRVFACLAFGGWVFVCLALSGWASACRASAWRAFAGPALRGLPPPGRSELPRPALAARNRYGRASRGPKPTTRVC
ncbi:hypothetical protein, partial [Streptomyces sp. NPDC057417]